jgi:hypothetical protein
MVFSGSLNAPVSKSIRYWVIKEATNSIDLVLFNIHFGVMSSAKTAAGHVGQLVAELSFCYPSIYGARGDRFGPQSTWN